MVCRCWCFGCCRGLWRCLILLLRWIRIFRFGLGFGGFGGRIFGCSRLGICFCRSLLFSIMGREGMTGCVYPRRRSILCIRLKYKNCRSDGRVRVGGNFGEGGVFCWVSLFSFWGCVSEHSLFFCWVGCIVMGWLIVWDIYDFSWRWTRWGWSRWRWI